MVDSSNSDRSLPHCLKITSPEGLHQLSMASTPHESMYWTSWKLPTSAVCSNDPSEHVKKKVSVTMNCVLHRARSIAIHSIFVTISILINFYDLSVQCAKQTETLKFMAPPVMQHTADSCNTITLFYLFIFLPSGCWGTLPPKIPPEDSFAFPANEFRHSILLDQTLTGRKWVEEGQGKAASSIHARSAGVMLFIVTAINRPNRACFFP